MQQFSARVGASGAYRELDARRQKFRGASRSLADLLRVCGALSARHGLEDYHLPGVGASVYVLRAEQPCLLRAALDFGECRVSVGSALRCGEEYRAARHVAHVAKGAQVRLRLRIYASGAGELADQHRALPLRSSCALLDYRAAFRGYQHFQIIGGELSASRRRYDVADYMAAALDGHDTQRKRCGAFFCLRAGQTAFDQRRRVFPERSVAIAHQPDVHPCVDDAERRVHSLRGGARHRLDGRFFQHIRSFHRCHALRRPRRRSVNFSARRGRYFRSSIYQSLRHAQTFTVYASQPGLAPP